MEQKKSILIIGRRWFESRNGNTYFSSITFIDGHPVSTIECEYGYGDHYKEQSLLKIEREGLIPSRDGLDWYTWSEHHGYKIYSYAITVGRKKDL